VLIIDHCLPPCSEPSRVTHKHRFLSTRTERSSCRDSEGVDHVHTISHPRAPREIPAQLLPSGPRFTALPLHSCRRTGPLSSPTHRFLPPRRREGSLPRPRSMAIVVPASDFPGFMPLTRLHRSTCVCRCDSCCICLSSIHARSVPSHPPAPPSEGSLG
jgi:hypothetical protein